MSDSKQDCSSAARITGGAKGTGIVEILMTRARWPNTTRWCPPFYTLSTPKVLAQDLRNGHLDMAKLSKVDAAKAAGVSRQTLYTYIKDGRLSVDADGLIDTAEL